MKPEFSLELLACQENHSAPTTAAYYFHVPKLFLQWSHKTSRHLPLLAFLQFTDPSSDVFRKYVVPLLTSLAYLCSPQPYKGEEFGYRWILVQVTFLGHCSVRAPCAIRELLVQDKLEYRWIYSVEGSFLWATCTCLYSPSSHLQYCTWTFLHHAQFGLELLSKSYGPSAKTRKWNSLTEELPTETFCR